MTNEPSVGLDNVLHLYLGRGGELYYLMLTLTKDLI